MSRMSFKITTRQRRDARGPEIGPVKLSPAWQTLSARLPGIAWHSPHHAASQRCYIAKNEWNEPAERRLRRKRVQARQAAKLAGREKKTERRTKQDRLERDGRSVGSLHDTKDSQVHRHWHRGHVSGEGPASYFPTSLVHWWLACAGCLSPRRQPWRPFKRVQVARLVPPPVLLRSFQGGLGAAAACAPAAEQLPGAGDRGVQPACVGRRGGTEGRMASRKDGS